MLIATHSFYRNNNRYSRGGYERRSHSHRNRKQKLSRVVWNGDGDGNTSITVLMNRLSVSNSNPNRILPDSRTPEGLSLENVDVKLKSRAAFQRGPGTALDYECEIPPARRRDVNMLQGCRSVNEFDKGKKLSEGSYGIVHKAKDRKTGEIVALKRFKLEYRRGGFPMTSLREINILFSLHHPSIVDIKEVVVGNTVDKVYIVMEYMEHDLCGVLETMPQPFSQSEVKCLMLQLLKGVKYLHDNWVMHRDLKTSNILLNNRGELKICDFGLARQYGSTPKPYSVEVVTLWYMAPELLLGEEKYSTAIDMWSLGCIMAELLAKEPLFEGESELQQLQKICSILGTPNEANWPGFSKLPGAKFNIVNSHENGCNDQGLDAKFPAISFTGSTPVLSGAGLDLLKGLLTYDPKKRMNAVEALNHKWFREIPLPKSKEFMPAFPV